ncbi:MULTISPECIES: LPS export ABC transporter ATP-binding protein [Thermodesulfobacterium]|jgi:lipopolysaccharide export system ATP-binding protein|uniref:ABC transporter n=2 Tax=Thermodesulfobacterium commune TaxID=1741 RepID=A0A075WR62_9BACT|nr:MULTISPECIES: LPS export ABC transporter ATP-binding protein [Thermodesulfobacterium]KUJ98079.1 MAG: Sulfate-transporting ATPase [Thermodesulfobacterium sp. 37_54]KUK19691.1 MAG: Sulfate-transporting ATPase [Thermodesulfobacterium commune]AIH03799.1 ABC transporter [Thermodesulfobacterium commune DSM 2178]KUK37662.1 MAG: Sulfate-transporting ATPase [Thermodesulfobacterium commune]MBZ4681711.1 transporter [Thermodesulfobacterium sp.]
MLKAKNLKKSFKKREVVHGVTVEIKKGEMVGLLGPNGAGKTTSFYMIAGFLKPDSGEIWLFDKNITDYDVSERANQGIIYLPQESSVFRKLTVYENFKMVIERLEAKQKEIEEKLDFYIDLFNLREVLHQKAYTLSGGQKRKVEIVRALLVEPSFILLDEPFAGIDPIGIDQLKNIFKTLRERNIGLLISDHNVRETLKICDRAYVIADGQIIGSGTPQQILENETVREKYLGERFKL